jgi:hypothetical protein
VDRRAGRNKFEFAKDLMERDSEENSGRGMGMTFCQRRKGTRRAGDRAGYVIGDREERSGDLGMTGASKRSALRERERIRCFSLVAGTERPRP